MLPPKYLCKQLWCLSVVLLRPQHTHGQGSISAAQPILLCLSCPSYLDGSLSWILITASLSEFTLSSSALPQLFMGPQWICCKSA